MNDRSFLIWNCQLPLKTSAQFWTIWQRELHVLIHYVPVLHNASFRTVLIVVENFEQMGNIVRDNATAFLIRPLLPSVQKWQHQLLSHYKAIGNLSDEQELLSCTFAKRRSENQFLRNKCTGERWKKYHIWILLKVMETCQVNSKKFHVSFCRFWSTFEEAGILSVGFWCVIFLTRNTSFLKVSQSFDILLVKLCRLHNLFCQTVLPTTIILLRGLQTYEILSIKFQLFIFDLIIF